MATQQPRTHSSRHALGTNMAGGFPGPTAPAMPREPSWQVAAPAQSSHHAPGTNVAKQQPQAHSSLHAMGTNMAGGSSRPTAPAMPWERTWPLAAPGPELPHCHENQNGRRQPRDNSSRHALATNVTAGQPRAHSCRRAPGINMAGAVPSSQLPPCPGNQHGHPTAPGPTAPAMPWELTWPAAPPGPQLPPCPENQNVRRQQQAHSSRYAPGTNMAARQPQAHRFRHVLLMNMAHRVP